MRRFALFLLLTLTAHQTLMGAVIKVCATCQTQTLARAYELAAPHDTLLFLPGNHESIAFEIKKPLTLLGEKGAVLDGKK